MKNSAIKIDLRITNDYLLKTNNGYLLIDTGYDKLFEVFIDKIKLYGIKPNDIKYLFLTHHHDDHAGFVNRLRNVSDFRLIAHKKAVKYLLQGKTLLPKHSYNLCVKYSTGVFFKLFKGGKNNYPPIEIMGDDILIEEDEGNFLKNLGIKGKIITTPGHSDDSISIVLDNGDAFVGDAAMNFMPFCKINYHPIFYTDIKLVYKSWQKLIDSKVKTIYPAHGKNFAIKKMVKILEDKNVKSKGFE